MRIPTFLSIALLLSLGLFGSIFLVTKTTTISKRAHTSSSTVALENSYLFASPLQAKADGLEQIRLTVFLLDGRGLGVPNQSVKLNLPTSVRITKSQEITDQTGKAVFDLISPTPQTLNVSASVGTSTLPQKVKITFY
ncbi:Ig-like domain-containing protein [Candidatus Shapirobacteria bacterium]|nr:Ig-like domain-containing protein [Candidatus Shapirobacteria bacterium]